MSRKRETGKTQAEPEHIQCARFLLREVLSSIDHAPACDHWVNRRCDCDWSKPLTKAKRWLRSVLTQGKQSAVPPCQPETSVCGSVSEFQREVSTWAAETFPHQTPHSKMTHLRKEIDELTEDTSDGEEMADCFILLLNLAEMAGVDLMTEARRKMEINRKRKWGEPDADGVCSHVKKEAPSLFTTLQPSRPLKVGKDS